jgi:CheY-like chemotaxis protein
MAKSLLIIEDDLAVSEVYIMHLSDLPITFTTAPDGVIGLQKMELEAFDLVLLDLLMPNMTGLEVMLALHERGIPTPPIVVCSSLTEYDLITDALFAGASDYLTKPITSERLRTVVATFLGIDVTGASSAKTGQQNQYETLTQVNTQMVLSKKSGTVNITTTRGVGTIVYDSGKAVKILYDGSIGLAALEKLKKTPATNIEVLP